MGGGRRRGHAAGTPLPQTTDMSKKTRRTLLRSLGAVAGVSGAAGVAKAQEGDNEQDETTTDNGSIFGDENQSTSTTESGDGSGGGDGSPILGTTTSRPPEEREALASVDQATDILDYRVEADPTRVVIETRSQLGRDVSLADFLGAATEEGVSKIETKETTIPEGIGEVSKVASEYRGLVAVSFATAANAVTVSAGAPSTTQVAPLLQAAGMGVGATALYGAGEWYRRQEGEKTGEPEPVWED